MNPRMMVFFEIRKAIELNDGDPDHEHELVVLGAVVIYRGEETMAKRPVPAYSSASSQ